MAQSEHLKDLKAVWGESCHSMWAELLSIAVAENTIRGRYGEIGRSVHLNDFFYAPEVKDRLGVFTKDNYLERSSKYKDSVITNRIIILSASFELYLNNFIESFIRIKPKFYDQSNNVRTEDGNKFFGEIIKTRGLSQRIIKMADLASFKIRSLSTGLEYLEDVYTLRNVLAHRAGNVDEYASKNLKHARFGKGDRVILTAEQMMDLAAPVIEVANSLDLKIQPKASS